MVASNFIYPKNKEKFIKLLPFAKKILLICLNNNIPTAIYGSFAHFYNTQDKSMKVNDIDILIKGSDQKKLADILKKNKLKFNHYPEWKTTIIEYGDAKVEVDSLSSGYITLKEDELPVNLKKIDFYGIPADLITIEDLEEIYTMGYQKTKDNKKKISDKIKKLEKFLGRKLKWQK